MFYNVIDKTNKLDETIVMTILIEGYHYDHVIRPVHKSFWLFKLQTFFVQLYILFNFIIHLFQMIYFASICVYSWNMKI